jgi:hypothetical protein
MLLGRSEQLLGERVPSVVLTLDLFVRGVPPPFLLDRHAADQDLAVDYRVVLIPD